VLGPGPIISSSLISSSGCGRVDRQIGAGWWCFPGVDGGKRTGATNDADYYFLTVECGHKLFGAEVLKKIVKEAVYMASELYQHPYERGRSEGKLEGKIEGKSELVLKQLAKKFGCLPPEVRQQLAEAKPHQLDLIAEGIFDFRDLDDVLRYIAPPGDGARALPADSRVG
jgi:hypothetical protein